MGVEPISPAAVRDALRAIRYARSMGDSPLAWLDVVTLRLRSDGLADTRQGRAWALGRIIEGVVAEKVALLRNVESATIHIDAAPERVLELLRDDLRSDHDTRINLALMQARYLSPSHLAVRTICEAIGVSERSIHYRVARGVDALTEALREREVAVSRQLATTAGARPHERILVTDDARARTVVELLGELMATLRSEGSLVRVTAEQLVAASRYPSAKVIAYRLGRIAEWSQPRYRLDERFVELSMLVDLGSASASGRWKPLDERFGDLREALGVVTEPAVVLLGPPGSGKSTVLRRLELDVAVDALSRDPDGAMPPLTFLISLNDYRPAGPGGAPQAPMGWLANRWQARFPKLPPLEDLMATSPMLFLLDGLNEIPHQSDQGYHARLLQWKRWLHETLTGAGGHRAVIACRSLDYSAPLSTPQLRVPQVRLEPLADERVEEFLRRYSPEAADRLWQALRDTPMLEPLRWPYFLRLLVESHADTGELRPDLAALFTAFVRRAFALEVQRDNRLFQPSRIVAARDIQRIATEGRWPTPYDLPAGGTLFPKLATLAFGMQAESIEAEALLVRIDHDEALRLLDCDEATLILQCGGELGVLDEDADSGDIQFRHQLLQEHFAARHLALQPDPELLRIEWRAARRSPSADEAIDGLQAGEPLPLLPQTGWEETVLQSANLARDPAAFLSLLMPANLELAGRAASVPGLREWLSAPLLDELRWSLVRRSRDPAADPRHRIACGLALGELGDPRFERHAGPHGAYLMPPLVDIPSGRYPVGGNRAIEWTAGDISGMSSAHIPRHLVRIDALAVGRFPVTNAEWACFQAAGGYDDPRWWVTRDADAWRRGELPNEGSMAQNRMWRRRFLDDPELFESQVKGGFYNAGIIEVWRHWLALDEGAFEVELAEYWKRRPETKPRFWTDRRFNHPSQPVVGVNWFEARAYCAWLTAQTDLEVRLPTEVEWEAAAGGTKSRPYPWGDGFDRWACNTAETHVLGTTPIGVFPEGDTDTGVTDMAGNVQEWVLSLFGAGSTEEDRPDFEYPYQATDGREDEEAPAAVRRVVRGGSWFGGRGDARSAYRDSYHPDRGTSVNGLRLVVGRR